MGMQFQAASLSDARLESEIEDTVDLIRVAQERVASEQDWLSLLLRERSTRREARWETQS